MITKVRFPEPIDVYGDGKAKAEWEPGKDGVESIDSMTGNGILFVFDGGEKRMVCSPRYAILHARNE